jgi:hypothetical protein
VLGATPMGTSGVGCVGEDEKEVFAGRSGRPDRSRGFGLFIGWTRCVARGGWV